MSPTTENTQPVPALCGDDDGVMTAAWLSHSASGHWDVHTSLPVVENWHRQKILEIVDSDCVKARSRIGTVIEIGHYICHPAEVRSRQTGKIQECVRTVLPQSDGPPISFVSKTIVKAIAKLAWATGRTPPFDPPLKCRLKVSGDSDNIIYRLELVT